MLLAGALLPCALFVAAARWWPRLVLGPEGQWLVQKLTGRRDAE